MQDIGVLQSFVSDSENISVFSIVLSLTIVGAFIGGTLTIGSNYVPKLIDMINRINDYALLLISILGLHSFWHLLPSSLGFRF